MRQEILLIFVLMMLSPVVFYFVVDKKDDSALVVQRKNNQQPKSASDAEGAGLGVDGAGFEIDYRSSRVNNQALREAYEENERGASGSDSEQVAAAGSEQVSPSEPETDSELDWMALYSRWELNYLDAASGKTQIEDVGSSAKCSMYFVADGKTTTFTSLSRAKVSEGSNSIEISQGTTLIALQGLRETASLKRATDALIAYCGSEA